MNFYLVRHGDAVSEREDPKRPLSERGRKEVEQIGRKLAASEAQVFEILHSDKLRARETAEILGRFLPPAELRQSAGLAPDDDPEIARAELEIASAPLMLVGHLPHLGRLLSLLLSGDSEGQHLDLPTAAATCVFRDSRDWKLQWIFAPQSV